MLEKSKKTEKKGTPFFTQTNEKYNRCFWEKKNRLPKRAKDTYAQKSTMSSREREREREITHV